MERILVKKELEDISGGAIHWGVIAGIFVGVGAFFAGIVDGYLRPYSCRK